MSVIYSYFFPFLAAEPAESSLCFPSFWLPTLASTSLGQLKSHHSRKKKILKIPPGNSFHSAISTISVEAQLAALIRSVTQLPNLVCTLPYGDSKANLSFIISGSLSCSHFILQGCESLTGMTITERTPQLTETPALSCPVIQTFIQTIQV